MSQPWSLRNGRRIFVVPLYIRAVLRPAIPLPGAAHPREFVQQPCSNPSKSPAILGKVSTKKIGDLREFCKLRKPPANYRAAFTRQRSLVRNQHRPLRRTAYLSGEICGRDPPRPGELYEPVDGRDRREGLARPRGHLDEGARPVLRQRALQVVDRLDLRRP